MGDQDLTSILDLERAWEIVAAIPASLEEDRDKAIQEALVRAIKQIPSGKLHGRRNVRIIVTSKD